MFIEIERITTTTYIKDINLIDTNMMGPRHYHGNKSIGHRKTYAAPQRHSATVS